MSSVNRVAGSTLGRSLHFVRENLNTLTEDVRSLQNTVGMLSSMFVELKNKIDDIEKVSKQKNNINNQDKKNNIQSLNHPPSPEHSVTDNLVNNINNNHNELMEGLNGGLQGISFSNQQ
jgi:predicted RNase H-like nuclease (RuvC/YqgF family)